MISQLKQKNSFLRSVATLTSGTAIAQLIAIIASPVITRLYTPADMGVLASYVAITAILGIVATGHYELAIVLPEDDLDANALVYLGGIIVIAFGFLITIVFVLFGNRLAHILQFQNISDIWLYGIGIFVVLIGFEAILNRLVIRRKHFKISATTTVTQQIGANGINVSAGFLGFGTNGLLLATLSSHLIRGIRLLFTERDFVFNKDIFPKFDRIKAIALRYKKFPLLTSWSSLLNSASTQLPVILFTSFFSASVAGYYSLCHRILSLPMGLIGNGVGQVFLERAVRTRNNPDELKRITFELYKKLLLIGVVIMSFVVFYGDKLFPFVFGNEWLIAGKYAQWMAIWLVFVLAASPLSSLYTVLERQGEGLIINTVMFSSRISVIIIASIIRLSDMYLIACFSIIGVLLWICMCFRILYLVRVPVFETIRHSLFIVFPIAAIQFIFSIFLRSFL